MESSFGFESLRKGMKVRVRSVSSETSEAHRLMELGLIPGTEFTVTKVAPLGDPIEISLRGYRLCLRRKETSGIALETVD